MAPAGGSLQAGLCPGWRPWAGNTSSRAGQSCRCSVLFSIPAKLFDVIIARALGEISGPAPLPGRLELEITTSVFIAGNRIICSSASKQLNGRPGFFGPFL